MNAPQHGAQRVTDETPAWNLDGTDGTSSQDAIEPSEMAGPGTGTSGISITDAQRIAIVALATAGISRTKICMHVFGSKGRNFDKVRAVLDEAGL